MEFRELSASQVWSGAVFANDRLRDSGGRERGVATPDVPTSPPKPRRAEGGERVQAKVTRRKQVRPTNPLGGRGKRKEASEKLVTSEATTTSGEESSSSAESRLLPLPVLGKGGGGLLRPSVFPQRLTGSKGESLGWRGGGFIIGARPRQGVGRT